MHSKDFYIIQGNTDNMLSVFSFDTYNAILEANAVMASAYLADSQILTQEEKDFLKNLPTQHEIELFGIKILLVHGSPRKNNENIYPNLRIKEVEEITQKYNEFPTAMQGLGYKEVVSYLKGGFTKEEMIDKIKMRSVPYGTF